MLLIFIIAIIAVAGVFFYKYKKSTKETEQNTNFNQELNNVPKQTENLYPGSTETNNTNVIDLKQSNKFTLLTLGEKGKTTKKEKDNVFKDVEVELTKVYRGLNAETILNNYYSAKGSVYPDAQAGMEWVVAEYKVDVSNLKMTEYGNTPSLEATVEGTGNNTTVKYNNKFYNITTVDINSTEYKKEKVLTGKVAMQLPEGCTDYVLVLGDGETKAYFKGE